MPILSDKTFKDGAKPISESSNPNTDDTCYLNHKLLYLHPAFKYESPKIWLPKDPHGYTDLLLQKMLDRSQFEGENDGAQVQLGKFFSSLKLMISEAPPDYK